VKIGISVIHNFRAGSPGRWYAIAARGSWEAWAWSIFTDLGLRWEWLRRLDPSRIWANLPAAVDKAVLSAFSTAKNQDRLQDDSSKGKGWCMSIEDIYGFQETFKGSSKIIPRLLSLRYDPTNNRKAREGLFVLDRKEPYDLICVGQTWLSPTTSYLTSVGHAISTGKL
jgi:hypothetical protein